MDIKEELMELDTILVALNDKIHKVQEILQKVRNRLDIAEKEIEKNNE